MIVLDTHIWVWWVQADPRLTQQYQRWLQHYQSQGLGVSIFSRWELPNWSKINDLFSLCLSIDGLALLSAILVFNA